MVDFEHMSPYYFFNNKHTSILHSLALYTWVLEYRHLQNDLLILISDTLSVE